MDKLREKLATLKQENEEAQEAAETANQRAKQLEDDNLAKEHEIASLVHQNTRLEDEVAELETKLKDAKGAAEEGAAHGTAKEALSGKVSTLEAQLDETEEKLKEAEEKARQHDLKHENLERQVSSLEKERDTLESKLEELTHKYTSATAELEEINKQLEAI